MGWMKDNSPLTGNTGESPLSAEPRGKVRPEVFVIGGIHQSHEGARFYTYERLGELFDLLAPDLLCVEVLQRHLDDGTDTGMPRDFRTHMVPRARAAGIPVVGIDWWHDSRGEEWRRCRPRRARILPWRPRWHYWVACSACSTTTSARGTSARSMPPS
jgi:hypothetical protein